MPRYYFNIRSAEDRYNDPEGSEYDDTESALHEAKVAAREISADRLRQGLPTNGRIFEIKDADGAVVGTVPFPRLLE